MTGALGPMAQMMGGGTSMTGHVYISGPFLRIDMGTGTTIIDAARREVTRLDHVHRTRATAPFSSFASLPRDTSAGAASVSVTVRQARELTRVNGVETRHVTVVARVPSPQARAPNANDLVVTIDTWAATNAAAARAYQRIAQADQEIGGASATIAFMSQNPRLATALAKALKEAARHPGLPVRRITAYGKVPPVKPFTAGMRMDTTMAITTDVVELHIGRLEPSLFRVPEGYR